MKRAALFISGRGLFGGTSLREACFYFSSFFKGVSPTRRASPGGETKIKHRDSDDKSTFL